MENTASGQAATDVRAAYAALSARTCGTVLDITLAGQTLTPATYCTGAAAALNGTLTLDGQGDANALFIINVGGALSAGTAASVVLTNGANARNVYWRVAGRFDLGENAVFQGTVLADGAIALLDGATLVGRGLSQAGVISLQRNEVSLPLAANPLPVKLTAFSAERQAQGALLRWTTASEQHNAYFEVQSSRDGQHFTALGRVASKEQQIKNQDYTWSEASLVRYASAVVYYRLQQVDLDGTSTYSPVRTVVVEALAIRQFLAFPNPSQGALGVQVDLGQEGVGTLRLTDATGCLMLEKQLTLAAGSNLLNLPEAQALRPGLYHLQLQQDTQRQVLTLVRQ